MCLAVQSEKQTIKAELKSYLDLQEHFVASQLSVLKTPTA